ncbi:ABC transporter substrate-binding protein [Cumulibacter soli]|uniref:ABC transporter substrate-binding protein n=1 Tax=Cumulibacter soli TaxID=2546344 RepID=UPI0010685722|nr:ABC transporter substrate-binding protein [Cumulibacter soli]
MNHRRTGLLAISLVACLALATGCGSDSGNTGGSSEREASTSDCPPVDDAKVDPEGHFTWIYSVGNTGFDPATITTNNSQMYLYPIYDSLVHVDAAGEPQPMLASDWEISEDGLSLEMDLISGWTYHDGTPFDAESVKANLDRHRAQGSWNANALSDVAEVTVNDAATVTITTQSGAAPLVPILAGSAGMMMSPAVFDDPSQELNPTGGSGAFTLASYQPGASVHYEAVDNYWDPDALKVKEMTYLISGDDNARLNSVLTGQSDTTFLRASMYEAAQADPAAVVCEAPSLSAYNFTLNVDKAEFDKPEVREAIDYAIDRQSIAAVTNGFCAPGVQMYPDFYFAASDNLTPSDEDYNPEKAKELLASVGLEEGFSFSLVVINLALYQQIAEVIQANLAAVGITMEILPVDISKLADDFSVNQSADAQMSEQKAEQDPSIQVESYLLEGGFMNPGGWSNDEVADLAEQARTGKTNDERGELYAELFEKVDEVTGPNITLCHLTTPFVLNDQTMGVEIYADASRQFRGVAKATS